MSIQYGSEGLNIVAPKKKGKKGSKKKASNSVVNQSAPPASPEGAGQQDAQEAAVSAAAPEVSDEPAQKPKGPSPIGFAQGTKEELSKVVWPDRQQLISESAAVILMVSFLAIFISFIDNLFSWASQLVF